VDLLSTSSFMTGVCDGLARLLVLASATIYEVGLDSLPSSDEKPYCQAYQCSAGNTSDLISATWPVQSSLTHDYAGNLPTAQSTTHTRVQRIPVVKLGPPNQSAKVRKISMKLLTLMMNQRTSRTKHHVCRSSFPPQAIRFLCRN
jgi:hypothetical protein